MRVLYRLSDVSVWLLFSVYGYRRDVIRKNLQLAFPSHDEKGIEKIEKAFYRHFCDLVFETLKSISISKTEIDKRFRLVNPELPLKYFQDNRNIILYSAHYGNWEWMSFIPLTLPYQGTTFYQPFSNRYFDKLIRLVRERFGAKCIESTKGYKALIAYEQANVKTMNMVVGDQSPRPESEHHWVPFLNQKTAFLTGPAQIAVKRKSVILFPKIKKVNRGFYELEFVLINEGNNGISANELITTYSNQLQQCIQDSPELWLWSHKRWKLTTQY